MSNQANQDALAAHIKAWGKENPSGALRGIESSFAEYLAQAGVLDPSVMTVDQWSALGERLRRWDRGANTSYHPGPFITALAQGDV